MKPGKRGEKSAAYIIGTEEFIVAAYGINVWAEQEQIAMKNFNLWCRPVVE